MENLSLLTNGIWEERILFFIFGVVFVWLWTFIIKDKTDRRNMRWCLIITNALLCVLVTVGPKYGWIN